MNTQEVVAGVRSIIGLWTTTDRRGASNRERLSAFIDRVERDESQASEPAVRGRPPVKIGMAVDFLRSVLANGPVSASELRRAAAEAGLGHQTVARARTKLGVVTRKSGYGGQWMVSMPVY